MGQSPIEDVVGAWFAKHRPDILPIMYRSNGKPVWPIAGGSGEDEGDDRADESGEDDADADEDDSDDDGGAAKDDKSKKAVSAQRAKELQDENSRRRNENKTLRKELADAAAKLKGIEDKDKSETDKITEERDELKTKVETLAATNNNLAIKVAFLETKGYEWQSPKAALRLLDLDGVEIGDDGEVAGLDKAIKKLADENKFLLKNRDDDEEESGALPKTGQPVGKKGAARTAALEQKYRFPR